MSGRHNSMSVVDAVESGSVAELATVIHSWAGYEEVTKEQLLLVLGMVLGRMIRETEDVRLQPVQGETE